MTAGVEGVGAHPRARDGPRGEVSEVGPGGGVADEECHGQALEGVQSTLPGSRWTAAARSGGRAARAPDQGTTVRVTSELGMRPSLALQYDSPRSWGAWWLVGVGG